VVVGGGGAQPKKIGGGGGMQKKCGRLSEGVRRCVHSRACMWKGGAMQCSALVCLVPWPMKYIHPSVHCAVAWPRSAACWYNRTAFSASFGTPPCPWWFRSPSLKILCTSGSSSFSASGCSVLSSIATGIGACVIAAATVAVAILKACASAAAAAAAASGDPLPIAPAMLMLPPSNAAAAGSSGGGRPSW
jgi:hypothetical protein